LHRVQQERNKRRADSRFLASQKELLAGADGEQGKQAIFQDPIYISVSLIYGPSRALQLS
jgi:hypothetical protein